MADNEGEAWLALRETDRELACCLLFLPSDLRGLLSDLLSLAHECENAIRIPSESMLAAIRLQWWVDALAGDDPTVAPLAERLHGHLRSGKIGIGQLHALIGLWQDRLQDGTLGAAGCWAQAFAMMPRIEERHDFARMAADIGRCFASDEAPDVDLKKLRRQVGPDTRWLFLLACLTRYGQISRGTGTDGLLVWRMLAWRWGIRLPS